MAPPTALTDVYLQQITERPAWQVLTAGSSDELAADSGSRPGHSAFTSALLAGLEGLADQNRDGIITASELASYVMPVVSRETATARGQGQTPFFSYLAGSGQGDFVFLPPQGALQIQLQHLSPETRLLQVGTQRRNPYATRNGIRNPKEFYGRTEETRIALDFLCKGQSISLVGSCKVGKTSMLRHISNASVLEGHGLDPENFIFAFIDGQILAGDSQVELLNHILSSIPQKGPPTYPTDFPPSADAGLKDFFAALRRISEADLKLVLLFDEFEYLSGNEHLDNAFFAKLSGISEELGVSYVTASRCHLRGLSGPKGALAASFCDHFVPINLGPLSESEAKEKVREDRKSVV